MSENEKSSNIAYYLFGGIGVILILVSVIFKQKGESYDIPYDIFLNIGVSILTISIVEYLWKIKGGDPIITAINRLWKAISFLKDAEESGLEAIHLQRRNIDVHKWFQIISNAQNVDAMGINLRTNFAKELRLLEIIKQRAISKKCKFRILIFAPDSIVTKQRAIEEARHRAALDQISTEMQNTFIVELKDSLATFKNIRNEIYNDLESQTEEYFIIKLVDKSNFYCSIIRADDVMIVTKYLSHLTGSKSPSLEIKLPAMQEKFKNNDANLFQVFRDEFENMWKYASKWPIEV